MRLMVEGEIILEDLGIRGKGKGLKTARGSLLCCRRSVCQRQLYRRHPSTEMEILGTSMLLLGLLCVSAAVPLPTTTRPSRGNRTIPPDLVLPKDIEVLQVRKQRQVNISESLATEPLKPSDWESLAARKRNRTDTANESAIKEISTPSRKQDNGQVDYYYYYFDSFQEAVTDIADFDDMREGVARHEVEVKQNNSLVVEPLTIASWHTSQKSPGG